MSNVDQMIQSASVDVEKQVQAVRDQLESRNAYVQGRVEELRQLVRDLESEEDEDELDNLEDKARWLAEELEIEFIYTRVDGQRRVYTPEAFWEPSGGCEWVESAYEGSDFGWNIH